MTPQALLASSLLGLKSRSKIASEPFKRTKPPTKEESVADFVRRKFGHEILEYLVAPFVSGVYAGDPEKLSLKAAFPTLEEWEREYGSVLRGAMKSRSEKEKASRASAALFVQGWRWRRSRRRLLGNLEAAFGSGRKSRRWGALRIIRFVSSAADRSEMLEAAAVVIATPAYTASHIAAQVSSPLTHMLSGVAYAPVAVVACGYYDRQIAEKLDGIRIPGAAQREGADVGHGVEFVAICGAGSGGIGGDYEFHRGRDRPECYGSF